jgi:sigma-B regulation protein RsbU (phosphoserine phosphatase)
LTEPDQQSRSADAEFVDLLEDSAEDLYEQAPCGYLSALLDGTIVKVNQTFLSLTGYQSEELVGRRKIQDLLTPGGQIFYETHYAPMLRMQGSVREIAVSLRLPDGRRLPVLANSVLREDSTGRPEIVRTVLFDARERRAYEEELVAARRRAEESEASARALAQTLQATLLPPLEPSIPGLDVAGAYRPAGDGFTVGGDFFDVFRTGRGSHSVVLGDVSGKGPSAAVVTALVRYTVRAEALHSSSPAQVLRCVHEAMARYQPDRFCTAVLLEVAPTGAGADITVAVAGHEPPILTDGRTSRRVGEHGSILGMLLEVDVSDRPVPLRPGDSLVLYTDGISEARRGDEFFGEERIETLVTELAGKSDAAGIATGLADAAVSFQHGEPNDDIAVVVLKAGA